jgi:hypothetical protein
MAPSCWRASGSNVVPSVSAALALPASAARRNKSRADARSPLFSESVPRLISEAISSASSCLAALPPCTGSDCGPETGAEPAGTLAICDGSDGGEDGWAAGAPVGTPAIRDDSDCGEDGWAARPAPAGTPAICDGSDGGEDGCAAGAAPAGTPAICDGSDGGEEGWAAGAAPAGTPAICGGSDGGEDGWAAGAAPAGTPAICDGSDGGEGTGSACNARLLASVM